MDILKPSLLSLLLTFTLAAPTYVNANQAYKETLIGKIIESDSIKESQLNTLQNQTVPSNDINHTNGSGLAIDTKTSRAFANNLLSQAVDNLSFEFVGLESTPGFLKQEDVFNVDCDAAQSERITDNQTSIILTGVNGPTALSFDWKVSSESSFDGLAFSILGIAPNGQIFDTGIAAGIDGEVDWNTRLFQVPSGPHLLVWGYVKDSSVSSGSDTGWVDNVLIGPRGQVAPDLDNGKGCSSNVAAIPAIISLLLSDNSDNSGETPPPVDLPDILTLTPALPENFDGQFALRFESDQGDFIGRGQDQTFLQRNIIFNFDDNFDNGISLTLSGFSEEDPTEESDWSLDLAANDSRLSVGVYESASRFPFQGNFENGLDFSGNGRGCNTLNGQFRIFEIEYDATGNLSKLIADFEQFCGNSSASLRGSLFYDVSLAPDEFQARQPLPQNAVPIPAIPDNFPGQYFLKIDNPRSQPINGNQTSTYLQNTAIFSLNATSDSVSLDVGGFSSERPTSEDDLSLELSVKTEALDIGIYDRATRVPFNTFNGLSFTGNGSGCNQSVGSFRVFELEYDANGVLQKLITDFEQFCDGSTVPLRGSFVFDASKDAVEPQTVLPLPVDAVPLIQIPASFDGQYYVSVESESGDFIGNGLDYTYLQTTSLLNLTSTDSSISLSIDGAPLQRPQSNDDWELEMSAASGSALEVGVYPNATRAAFALFNGLSFSGNGSGCNQSTGEFRIFELERDLSGHIEKLVADWRHACDSSTSELKGVLVFDASKVVAEPLTVEPLPVGATITPSLPAGFNGAFAFRLNSENGDFIGQGQNLTYLGQDVSFNFTTNFDNGISLGFEGASQENINQQDRWTVELASQQSRLTTGLYKNASRWPFNTFNGLSFSGNGRGCNTSSGQFRIFEVEYNSNGDLIKLLADFEQSCGLSSSVSRGSLMYDASK